MRIRGTQAAVQAVRGMLDYQLAHGTTPADWEWPGVPFATSCGNQPDYGRCIENMPHEFYGGIETDKVGELGTGYALFYKLTGERKYLDAAVRCAQALARHVRAGRCGTHAVAFSRRCAHRRDPRARGIRRRRERALCACSMS